MDQALTPEDQESLAGFGEYLARLLAISTLSEEQKQAWATLVPEMTMDQLLKFSQVLAKYVDAKAIPELHDLVTKFEQIKKEHEEAIANLDRQAQSSLDAVMAQVKAAEQAAGAPV